MSVRVTKVPVGIVGAGPAGLMLAHLLSRNGIESVAIDIRSREEIEQTHRAGILEAESTKMLLDHQVSDRILREGYEHEGVELRYNGHGHRIHFKSLVNESVWLYPQQDVFIDLADARARDGGDVRFSVSDTAVHDLTTDTPRITFTDSDGNPCEIQCQIVVGSDGSRSICRFEVPEGTRRQYFREYPFAWFGILCEAPPSAPELIYAHSERGFALISQRTDKIQRMYFQCDPGESIEDWSEQRIWDELQARVAGDGFELTTGPIFEKTVLAFRSFVQEPMSYARLALAGDAAHTVPPTGAKGLNLALNDVRVLHEMIVEALAKNDVSVLEHYGPRALQRIWRSQHFSYWMTQMMHLPPNSDDFNLRRQLGELSAVAETQTGQRYLAEAYTGWPSRG